MIIEFIPQHIDASLVVERKGDTIVLNGDELDFSIIGEGADIPADSAHSLHPMILGPVFRKDGDLHVGVLLPVPSGCIDPWLLSPEPITVTEDGPVDLPFATYSETEEQKVEGGTNIVTTTYRWHQEPEISTTFVPDPEPVETTEEDA